MYISIAGFDVAATPVFDGQMLAAATLSTIDAWVLGKGSDTLERWSSLIGIITAIIGNILISFALNIQRYAHIRLHEQRAQKKERSKNSIKNGILNGYGATTPNGRDIPESNAQDREENNLGSSFHSTNTQLSRCSDTTQTEDSSYLKSPYWWGGIALMTIGEAGNFLAYGFAPASIVSPLGVVALVSNCVIAPIMLKEHFRLRDFWGVLVAIGGAVTVVLSAKQEEKKLGPHEIWGAITTMEFEIYMGVTIFLIGVLMWASPKYGARTILIDLGLVGLFGGYTALSTKGVASMLSYTLWRAGTTPVTYILLAVLFGTAVMQVKYVNKALQRFDSTQVIPVQFVMFTLSVIIGSAVLYRDFEKTNRESALKFIGGCLLTFFGVFLITAGRPSREDDSDLEESDGEGEVRLNLIEQERTDDEYLQDDSNKQGTVRRRAGIAQNGEAAQDEDNVADSRRSSRVSFMEPSRPKTPRMYSNSSNPPSIRVVPSAAASDTEDTPLLSNPWRTSSEELLAARHPGIQSNNSSPLLPSEAQTGAADSLKPPHAPSRSNSQGNVHTPLNLQQAPTPPQADRPVTPAKHSISRMIPGPFISPLSGGLSAIVADSLRRGFDSPTRGKSLRRLRRTKSGSQRLSHISVEDEELGTSPSKSSDESQIFSKSLGTENKGDWSRTRARSLSNTLSDLFRTRRQPPYIDGDEEAGPSEP